MSKYYHGTSYKNLLKIINDKKIKASIEGIVYLTKSKQDALKFISFRYMTEDIAVIELNLDDNNIIETFDHSQNFFKARSYGYKGDIDTSNVTNCWKYPVEGRFSI